MVLRSSLGLFVTLFLAVRIHVPTLGAGFQINQKTQRNNVRAAPLPCSFSALTCCGVAQGGLPASGVRRQRGALRGVATGLSGLSSVVFKINLEAVEKGLP